MTFLSNISHKLIANMKGKKCSQKWNRSQPIKDLDIPFKYTNSQSCLWYPIKLHPKFDQDHFQILLSVSKKKYTIERSAWVSEGVEHLGVEGFIGCQEEIAKDILKRLLKVFKYWLLSEISYLHYLTRSKFSARTIAVTLEGNLLHQNNLFLIPYLDCFLCAVDVLKSVTFLFI